MQKESWSPALFVASISDVLAGKAPAAAAPWFGSSFGSKPRFFEFGATPIPKEQLQPQEPAATQQPSGTPPCELQSFQLQGGRRSGLTPHAAKHVQNAMQAGMHQHVDAPSQPLFSFLNRHILPLLAYVAVAQHHAVVHFSERMRNWRRRNPFRQRHRTEHQAGESSIYASNGPRPARQAQRLYDAARALERSLDPLASAQAFMTAVQADPRQAEWLSLAAKQWSDAMYMQGVSADTAQRYNRTAIDTATKAMELSPDAAHSYIARCVSRGRLALLCDNKTKVQLAREACDDAANALKLEPNNDYAHHLMGRWHYEMAGLNPIARTLVRLLYGTSLMAGNYAAAAEHYRTATQLAPRTLVHRAELGRTLQKLGKQHEAIVELQAAMACEVEDLNAHLTKQEVSKLLDSLQKSASGRAFYLLPLDQPKQTEPRQ